MEFPVSNPVPETEDQILAGSDDEAAALEVMSFHSDEEMLEDRVIPVFSLPPPPDNQMDSQLMDSGATDSSKKLLEDSSLDPNINLQMEVDVEQPAPETPETSKLRENEEISSRHFVAPTTSQNFSKSP